MIPSGFAAGFAARGRTRSKIEMSPVRREFPNGTYFSCALLLFALVQGEAVPIRIRYDDHATGGEFMRPHDDRYVLGFDSRQGVIEILHFKGRRSAFGRGIPHPRRAADAKRP